MSYIPIKRHPSERMRRIWAARISEGEAKVVPVFVEGQWTLQIVRGNKRTMRVPIPLN